MAFIRLPALLRSTLTSKQQFDVALVQEFQPSKWRPKINWTGYQVHEEVKHYSLMLMEYVIRGALLTPVTDSGRDNLHFLVDTTDADIFRADKFCA